jgi:hypothetical protein
MMFSLRRWIRKYVYKLVVEEETIKAAAIDWHPVSKCRFCERPLMVECDFCPHCGYDLKERHTTGNVRLVNTSQLSELSPVTPTGVLRKYIQGDNKERPLQTLYKSEWQARSESEIRHDRKR